MTKETKTVRIITRVTESQREKFLNLGGGSWVRDKIDNAQLKKAKGKRETTEHKQNALPVVAWEVSGGDVRSKIYEQHPEWADGTQYTIRQMTYADSANAELAELRETVTGLRSEVEAYVGHAADLETALGLKDAELTTLRARLQELERQKPIYQTCNGVDGWLDVDLLRYTACGLEPEEFDTRIVYATPAPSQVAAEVVQALAASEKLISQMADRLEEDDALGDYDKELEQAYSLLSKLIVLNRAQPEVANNTGSRDMVTLIRQDQAVSLGVEDVASTDEAPKADVMRVPVELLTRICVKRTYIPGSLVADKAIKELRALLATSQEQAK